jgi:hypothetical protein
MREEHFNLSKLKGKEKRSALLMMLGRMNYLRGGFEQDIATKMEGTLWGRLSSIYSQTF